MRQTTLKRRLYVVQPRQDPVLASTLRVMARLNLTLDDDTYSRLEQHARSEGMARSAVARELLKQPLNRIERHARLDARDYARGHDDAEALLHDLEAGQFELLDA